MPQHLQRKPMRLPNYDYSMPGAYFVTACTKDRELLFETPEASLAVESAWKSVGDIFANTELTAFVVMPNHVHAILWIMNDGAYRIHPGTWKQDDLRRDRQLPVPTEIQFVMLSNIIGAFKTTAASRINKLRGATGVPVWQRSFYERVLRNERELDLTGRYIQHNPAQWEQDRDNPFSPEFSSNARSMDEYWNEIFKVTT